MNRPLRAWWIAFGAVFVGACGSSPPPEPQTPADDVSTDDAPVSSGMSIESEIGALDPDRTMETFQQSSRGISDCFTDGSKRVPYLAGRIHFEIRVDQSGNARTVLVRDSTLGDHETEQCMVSVLERASWPAPQGGKEGVAENQFEFDAGGGVRPPVDWTEADLGDDFSEARGELAACRQSASTGPVKATMYVDTEGQAKAVGASISDENGHDAVRCIVDKLRSITFPSPGSYASKVSFTID